MAQLTRQYENLKTEWWSMALGADGYVDYLSDIEQTINIILLTPQGSDPHRPTFAMDIFSFIDKPITEAIPFLVREAYQALDRWGERFQVREVYASTESVEQYYHFDLVVEWELVSEPPGVRQKQKFQTPINQLINNLGLQ